MKDLELRGFEVLSEEQLLDVEGGSLAGLVERVAEVAACIAGNFPNSDNTVRVFNTIRDIASSVRR